MRRRAAAGARRRATGLAAVLALAACGGDGGAPEDAPPIRDESLPASGIAGGDVVSDTQVFRDSLGGEFLVITTGRPRPRRLVPRAGSGDPASVERIDPADARARMTEARPPWYVIDVRPAAAWARGHLPGTALVPPEVLEANVDDLQIRTDQTILVYGDDDRTADRVARTLASYGFPDVRVLAGGFPAWERAGFPTEAIE